MNGKAPMITAEAFASMDSACTLAFIFLRSRSTLARFPSASDRLPPAWLWMVMTIAKKLTSGSGIVCIMRTQASGMLSPICCDSTTRRNSVFTGSWPSEAMRRKASLSGRPERMERTMTSRALGNSVRNCFWRRLIRKPTIQRGRPRAEAKPAPTAARRGTPDSRAINSEKSPNAPLSM